MNRIAIIGGGASGMTAALTAREAGAEVVLFEHNEKLGKKLAATGNGKCNLSNGVLTDDCYRGGDAAFVKQVLNACPPEAVREYLEKHGLMLKEKRGYYYPRSEQAASVVTWFASRLASAGVTVRCSVEVNKVTKERKGFKVSYRDLTKEAQGQETFDRVILATGGLAGQNLGAGPFGYDTAKAFGHVLNPMFPALVQLVAKDKNLKTLSGVRTDAEVHLYTKLENVENEYTEKGEVLFADYGVSGIAVMQLSRYAGDVLRRKGEAVIEFDFMPELSEEELVKVLCDKLDSCANGTSEDALCTLLPKKLLYVVFLRAGLKADTPSAKLSIPDIEKLSKEMKAFRLPVLSTKDFTMAQVTAGGVTVSGIHPKTMESKLQKGLYLTGELLDVDGTCGGYNLQFAFATGILAGTAAGHF
ncbi:MAG: NAD(P)/FAD-dependent oxidoreductase [Lachnospiraceae bacterium]|nr:NAD(P)/FAD-dependent oxidoreductase [Lachnospiraceae bacterium]